MSANAYSHLYSAAYADTLPSATYVRACYEYPIANVDGEARGNSDAETSRDSDTNYHANVNYYANTHSDGNK
jgi:hypothetical protein